MKVDFQFFRFEPKSVTFVSGTATPLLRSGGLFVHLKFEVLNFKLFEKYDYYYHYFFNLFLNLRMVTEFTSKDFKEAKVDQIYQFSKPITVCHLIISPLFLFSLKF